MHRNRLATTHFVQVRHRQTDRQTNRREYHGNSRSYCVTVRLAKNHYYLTFQPYAHMHTFI